MNRRYSVALRFRREITGAVITTLVFIALVCGFALSTVLHSVDAEPLVITPEVIVVNNYEKPSKQLENDTKLNKMRVQAGVTSVVGSVNMDKVADALEDKVKAIEETQINAQLIRCTGYCDYGYTKSGEYVRDGIVAGKEEWLGKKCNLYRVNEDNSIGELIGSYEFLDTGYGIKTKTANGVEGSIRLGKSIDVWHPSEDAVWDWAREYGDYVYMEIL